MAQAAEKPWTVEEFFAWQERRPERYELVSGFPLRLMAGASHGHDDIVVNFLSELRERLRGTGCRPFTGDGAVQTSPGQIRRPDAGVDCGVRSPSDYIATAPKMVAEVLLPSTRDFDTMSKVAEYKSVPSIEYVLVVEPNRPQVILWWRNQNGWAEARIEQLDAAAAMLELGLELPLAAIYEGITFPEKLVVSGI